MCWRCIRAAVCVRWPTWWPGGEKSPGKLTCASFGNGTSAHLSGRDAGTRARRAVDHVPKGRRRPQRSAGGRVTMMFGNWPEFRQHVRWEADRAGHGHSKTFGAGVGDRPRWPSRAWRWNRTHGAACWRAHGTRTPSVQTVLKSTRHCSRLPWSKAFRAADGGIVSLAGSPPTQFGVFIRSEIDKYADVIRRANITADTEETPMGKLALVAKITHVPSIYLRAGRPAQGYAAGRDRRPSRNRSSLS